MFYSRIDVFFEQVLWRVLDQERKLVHDKAQVQIKLQQAVCEYTVSAVVR